MSVEGQVARVGRSEEQPGKGPQGAVTLTSKLGGNWPIGKEGGWAGADVERQAR